MRGAIAIFFFIGVLGVLLFWGSNSVAPSRLPTTKTPTSTATPPKPFNAALITPGAINDKGWSENAYKGLQQIESELAAEISNATAKTEKEAFSAFRTYLTSKNDLIIGHASEWFGPKLVEIATLSPDTQILISGCEKPAIKNIAGIRFVLEDACYVLGFIAGSMSKTNVIGCVGPVKIPVIESTFFSFEKGAKAANPKIDVRIVWTQSWFDVARAKEQTLALIAEKADMIFHNANDGARGVFEAVLANKDKGILAFGSNDDQTAMSPEIILASGVLDIPRIFLDTAKDIKNGTFDGKTKTLGMAEGYVWIAYNKALEKIIPEDVRKQADKIIAEITEGKLKVERLVLK